MSTQDEAVIEAVRREIAGCCISDNSSRYAAERAIRAYLSALDKAGLAVVPKEPTQAMLDRVCCDYEHATIRAHDEPVTGVWKEMVSASPPPPGADTSERQP